MGKAAIRKAFEVKLNAFDADFATAWENSNTSFDENKPYQQVALMLAQPDNPTMGDNFYRQGGYFQIDLKYPQNVGPADADARADLLRATFHRGLSMTHDGITTVVEKTPEIGAGSYEGDRYVVKVFVRFFANIFAN